MSARDSFEKNEIKERVVRQYGVKLGTRIIKAADTIHSNSRKMSYKKAIEKAVEWVMYKFTREELEDMKD